MILLTLLFAFLLADVPQAEEKIPVILDADTANEVDDLYAIVRAFGVPQWEITALNATQWQASQWAPAEAMEESHRLNMILTGYLKPIATTKLRRGGYKRMYDWGDQAQHSAAAYEIISQAKALPEGDKLTVVAMGALTNVASALYIAPENAPKLSVYWLGTTYDFEKMQCKKLDFNALMDPQAVDLMLTTPVELHIMPINVVAPMTTRFATAQQELEQEHPLGAYLVNRWRTHLDDGRYERVLWDVALVEAIAKPSLASEVKATSFENPNVWLYKTIEKEAMMEDMYASIREVLQQLPEE
ncbi:nucleoside hydrolase [Marinoscillum furvescens]|uniref:Inosine-uridine preferring nucleoside hydrolase n=1 Tax=Marinoscillum furvescens DSM 4134 TaxID=1122208 RepID=A0A3D9L5R1_MARFU|nr:nucleoside hydrolase [Marinoscillum furvescens]REE01540.1 inosine-uridine preferring nucleoside hydrolase [Marinoscillum furvescens DSM 4134]